MSAKPKDDRRQTTDDQGASVQGLPRVVGRLVLLGAPLLLIGLVLAIALLTLALTRPAPAAVDVGAPGDAYALATFYPADPGGFRWSGPGSRLLIPAATDGALLLELRMQAPGFAPPEGQRLQLERDGETVAELGTSPSWRIYRIMLPPDRALESPGIRLEPIDLVAPLSYGPGDPRPLGVALDRFSIEAPPAGGGGFLDQLDRAAPLVWALALLAAYSLLASRVAGWVKATSGPGTTPILVVITCFGPLAPAAPLALWAWRWPLGFAWAVPEPPLRLLTGATLALPLVGLTWRRRALLHQKFQGTGHRLWLYAAGALLTAHLLLLAPPPWSGLGALAILFAPGLLVAGALFPEERSPATRLFLAIAGAVVVAPLLVLGLHAIPGPLPGWLLALAADALSAVLLWRTGKQRGREGKSERVRGDGAALAVVLAIAAGLRLWRLGGAEFQGDEARAMLLAAGVAQGADGILLTHTKGPLEALLPAGPLVIAGVGAEWVARLPFAIASIGALLGAIALLTEWTTSAGSAAESATSHPMLRRLPPLVALALLAVDGFSVGFGRIVQYQSIVVLAMAGAFWCCWRFYAGASNPARHLVAAAASLAVGVLAHYDAALVAPALGWLVVAGGVRRGWRGAAWARALAVPSAVGAALLASFFIPYILGPNFADVASYLAGRAGQGDAGGPPFNNLGLYGDIMAFYNAPPLIPVIFALVVVAVCGLLFFYVKPIALGIGLALIFAAATLAAWLAPSIFRLPGGGSLAGLAFALPLAGLCLWPGTPAAARAAAIWFGVAFCAEAFLIAEPRTHFYGAHLPAALLVGLALWEAGQRLASPLGQSLARLAACAAAILVVCGGGVYAQLLYLRQFPEYQRSFPAARPPLLQARYGDVLPEAGYFGFPHRDGWKAVAELYRAGALRGSYDTNQNRWLAGWYLRELARQCKGQPDLYLIAEAEPTVYFPPGYALAAEILVGPTRALAIYTQGPALAELRSYELGQLAAAFDSRPVAPFPAAALLMEEPPACT